MTLRSSTGLILTSYTPIVAVSGALQLIPSGAAQLDQHPLDRHHAFEAAERGADLAQLGGFGTL